MKYFIIDKSNNLLLQKNGDVYQVPQTINVQLPEESLFFDMKEKIGEDALAFGFESAADVDYLNSIADAELIPLRSAYNLLDYKDYRHREADQDRYCAVHIFVYLRITQSGLDISIVIGTALRLGYTCLYLSSYSSFIG